MFTTPAMAFLNHYTTNNDQTYNQPTAYGGDGGDAKARAKAKATATVTNRNTDINTNIVAPIQTNAMGQVQGMKNTIQDLVDITVEDVREFSSAPAGPSPDAKLVTHMPEQSKLKTSILENLKFITDKEAKMLARDADDVKITRGLFKKFPRGDALNVGHGASGIYMGELYLESVGPKTNAGAVLGKIWVEAMKNGATHVVLLNSKGKIIAIGSSGGFSLGGGTSVISNDGELGASGNGGIGKTWATAWNDYVPSVVISCYHDPNHMKY